MHEVPRRPDTAGAASDPRARALVAELASLGWTRERVLAEAGRRIAEHVKDAGGLAERLREYESLGFGRLHLTRLAPLGVRHFEGRALAECEPPQRAPCAMALSFLEATASAIDGAPSGGEEEACASSGAPACKFTVRPLFPPVPARTDQTFFSKPTG